MNKATNPKLTFKMFELLSGYWLACSIYAAAKLNIADLLADGPKSTEALALDTQSHAPSLYRLLRALASEGIFRETEDGAFELTPLATVLRSDVPGSLQSYFLNNMEEHYPAYGHLVYGIKTGKVPFEDVYGTSVWDYYKAHPEQGVNLMKSMTGISAAVITEILQVYDFTPFNHIIDIGGGNGALLFSILEQYPAVAGTVFDEPYVVERTQTLIPPALIGRCTTTGGNFFQSVPAGGALYTMKWVLHDWNDEESVAILQSCNRGMPVGSKLLIIDAVIPDAEKNTRHLGKLTDIIMFTLTTGKERTESEYVALLQQARLHYRRTVPTGSNWMSIIEAEKL